jgi:choline-sulfatase
MYAESVGVPLILRGHGVSAATVQKAAVSHVDIFNTVLDAVGADLSTSTASVHSKSLLRNINPERVVLSEYHTVGSKAAVFMIQDCHTKYVHYCDHPPQLFNLDEDPEEMMDLACYADHKQQLAEWEKRLRQLCNPDEVDRKAKQRQRELVEFYGGEDAIRDGKGIGGYTPSPLL